MTLHAFAAGHSDAAFSFTNMLQATEYDRPLRVVLQHHDQEHHQVLCKEKRSSRSSSERNMSQVLHIELVFNWHCCLCLLLLQPLDCFLEGDLYLINLTITAGLCGIPSCCRGSCCL